MKDQVQSDINEIRRLARHMMLTIEPLQSDVDFADNQLDVNRRSQFWRRTAIRCGLALVEATLWNMKHLSERAASLTGFQLTTDDLRTIKEEKTRVKDGTSFARHSFLPFPQNLKATFSIFAKVHGVSLSTQFDSGFDALCKTYELRSRLMHPKQPFDVSVSDNDIDIAQRGAYWLNRELAQLMKQCGETGRYIKEHNRAPDTNAQDLHRRAADSP